MKKFIFTRVKNSKSIWFASLVLIIIGTTLLYNSCTRTSEKETEASNLQQPAQAYDNSFDKVIIARAYLDGVQEKVSSDCPRALVGFKFINDRSVKDFSFDGMTYEQAVKVVAEDWRPLVVNNLSADILLSEQQMAVITLVAMRMGKTGFLHSTFLKEVNKGNFKEATRWILLQKTDGSIRPLGEEPTQYFYMLRLLWNEEIQIDALLDLPMFSYRALPTDKLYIQDSIPVFNSDIYWLLTKGYFTTPRNALKL